MIKINGLARPDAQTRRRGSTMIEVMVAILILAFGMMGMLGMFLNSLKISSGSIYRNSATQHAYMMADIMRANVTNLQNYFSPTATATSACFTSSGCTTTQIPNTEYKVWQTQLAGLLPAGQGKVCRDSVASNSSSRPTNNMASFMTCDNTGELVVKVCWDETRIQSGNFGINNSNSSQFQAGSAQCIYTGL
jgi:type IV pilus assembly protein PilV